MNQTKKRLSIINFAISITDIETIQLQVSKLRMLKTDEKIQEIITAIESENYANAQKLIALYMETITENILQRTSQSKQTLIKKEEQAIIDEFDLFVTADSNEKMNTIDINAFFDNMPPIEKKQVKITDFDTLLHIDTDHILADNIKLDLNHSSKDTFFESEDKKEAQPITTRDIPKDTFFDTEETPKSETPKEAKFLKEMFQTIVPSMQEIPKTESTIETPKEETIAIVENDIFTKNDLFKELKPQIKVQKITSRLEYKPIPHISQKITSMTNQYPTIQQTDENFDSVENLLSKISQEGYSEKEIEEALNHVNKLTEKTKYAEAGQLLLVCAATESKFAQFMLARELYKGTLLTKNISESFTHMNSLVIEDYPEALCDLGQFYENGIGTGKDKKKAEQLYKEAMESGISRAEKHYARMKKQNRGFF